MSTSNPPTSSPNGPRKALTSPQLTSTPGPPTSTPPPNFTSTEERKPTCACLTANCPHLGNECVILHHPRMLDDFEQQLQDLSGRNTPLHLLSSTAIERNDCEGKKSSSSRSPQAPPQNTPPITPSSRRPYDVMRNWDATSMTPSPARPSAPSGRPSESRSRRRGILRMGGERQRREAAGTSTRMRNPKCVTWDAGMVTYIEPDALDPPPSKKSSNDARKATDSSEHDAQKRNFWRRLSISKLFRRKNVDE